MTVRFTVVTERIMKRLRHQNPTSRKRRDDDITIDSSTIDIRGFEKQINFLKGFIGKKIIRTCPVNDDYSFTTQAIELIGISKQGKIIYKIGNRKPCEMSLMFTDFKWQEYEKALRSDVNHPLYQFVGKKIIRCKGVILNNVIDKSYMYRSVTLLAINSEHIVIECENRKIICDYRYTNPYSWKLI